MKSAFTITGRVEAVLAATNFGSSISVPLKKIQLVRGHGVRDDNHAGMRLADSREIEFLSVGFSKGTEIANHREFSVVSAEDLNDIEHAMCLPSPIPHGCLGENLVFSGIPKLTLLPTGTMLFFRKNERQMRSAVLVVWSENNPCQAPGEAIQLQYPQISGLVRLFPKSAIGKRGVVGSIYASGNVHIGDTVIVKVPRQQIYTAE